MLLFGWGVRGGGEGGGGECVKRMDDLLFNVRASTERAIKGIGLALATSN